MEDSKFYYRSLRDSDVIYLQVVVDTAIYTSWQLEEAEEREVRKGGHDPFSTIEIDSSNSIIDRTISALWRSNYSL